MRYALADVMSYGSHNRRFSFWSLKNWTFSVLSPRHVPTLWRYCFERFDTTSFQEIILSSGFFRRETAIGFYPWGNVEGPRKRVSEGMCGWRHGNSFPMTKAHSRTAKCEAFHVAPRLFFMFLFLITLTIRQQSIIIAPLIFLRGGFCGEHFLLRFFTTGVIFFCNFVFW